MYEPYRIKVVEPLLHTTRRQRKRILKRVGYNPFGIPAEFVTIDLISDSGTGAMTSSQWAAMFQAREDFAGQTSHEDFVTKARSITGFPHVLPVHQGRAAENILFKTLLEPGDTVAANTHFETTRGNIESIGCRAIDLPSDEPPFLGNVDVGAFEKLNRGRSKVKILVMTLTNNIKGGQPVSMENIDDAKIAARRSGTLLVFDASRFTDNAYLIKEYTKSRNSIGQICRRMFRAADILYLSSKKTGLSNIGGLICVRTKDLYDRLSQEIIRQEAYPTSGGLAARDVAAMATGLVDSMEEDLLRAHIGQVRSLAYALKQNGVEVFEPVGGHAVVIVQKAPDRHAAFALAAAIYLESGIRVGVFDDTVRLAVPRRVYTDKHLAYTAQTVSRVYHKDLPHLRLVHKPSEFYNFFARFTEIAQRKV
ncbi:MAG: tryptophanase [candidate division WOR-3 bacterium]|nr:MAG: tryptophanase [candidate division WOR-3 bacterium]